MQVSVSIIKSLIEWALDKKRDNHVNRNYEINSMHWNIYVWDIYDITSGKYHIIEIKMDMGYLQPVYINFRKNEIENEAELKKMFKGVFKWHSKINFGIIE